MRIIEQEVSISCEASQKFKGYFKEKSSKNRSNENIAKLEEFFFLTKNVNLQKKTGQFLQNIFF